MEIERFIRQHFELPHAKNNTQEYLRLMIYLSQIVQATCTKYESEHYLRLQDNLINNEGHTMGALYWQLNDIWQGPSWSSIEYGGRWKVKYYFSILYTLLLVIQNNLNYLQSIEILSYKNICIAIVRPFVCYRNFFHSSPPQE